MYLLSRESCSIDMGDRVIITGGLWMAATRVTVYNSLGFVAEYLHGQTGQPSKLAEFSMDADTSSTQTTMWWVLGIYYLV